METVHFCGKSPNNLIFLVKNSTYFHSYLLFFVILHQQRVVVNYLFVYIDLVAKFARILAIVVISIIFVNIILFISFSIPAVQKHAADFALEKLEPVIGTEARLEGIRIRLFNTVELKGLYVEDQQQDTLLYAGKLTVRIHAMDLLRNKLSVRKVGLENFVADIYRETPDDPFNFQFIIDTFAKEKDTTTVKKKKKNPGI